jgi:hypothetical protein
MEEGERRLGDCGKRKKIESTSLPLILSLHPDAEARIRTPELLRIKTLNLELSSSYPRMGESVVLQ